MGLIVFPIPGKLELTAETRRGRPLKTAQKMGNGEHKDRMPQLKEGNVSI